MKNDKSKTVALNDELLDKVTGGGDKYDDNKYMAPFSGPGVYWIHHEYCGNTCLYETPYPKYCNACSMPLHCVDLSQE
ncbi:MAG: hypothetical protein J6Y26_04565 [Lachnospiraceae bacterium]|nr:hypothetical protein [Lachnospiraceae bacterium]